MNMSTRFSPNELMYGLRLRSSLDQAAEEKGHRARTTPYQKGIMCEDADRNITEAQGRAKEHYETTTATIPTCVIPGQRVMLKQFVREDCLDNLYDGPYEVVEVKHPNVKVAKEKKKLVWVHLNNCKVLPPVPGGITLQHENSPTWTPP